MDYVKICNNCYSNKILYHQKGKWICQKCKSENNYFDVDDLCADAIQILNKRGYKTSACCEGHYINSDMLSLPYIGFNCIFDSELFIIDNLVTAKINIIPKDGNNLLLSSNWDVHFMPTYKTSYRDRFIFNSWKVNFWKQLTKYLINK